MVQENREGTTDDMRHASMHEMIYGCMVPPMLYVARHSLALQTSWRMVRSTSTRLRRPGGPRRPRSPACYARWPVVACSRKTRGNALP
jgi:hypothetical protein